MLITIVAVDVAPRCVTESSVLMSLIVISPRCELTLISAPGIKVVTPVLTIVTEPVFAVTLNPLPTLIFVTPTLVIVNSVFGPYNVAVLKLIPVPDCRLTLVITRLPAS